MTSNFAIVCPAYNEAGNIMRIADLTNRQLSRDGLFGDLIFVNDGSRDSTQEEITAAKSRYANIIGLVHATNRGYGEALKTGFGHVVSNERYIFALIMDADLTMDPKYILGFYEEIVHRGYDFVIGSRYSDGGRMEGVPLHRRIVSRGAALVSNFCFRLPICDYSLGFRAIRVELLRKMQLRESGFPILIEQVYRGVRLSARFSSVPIVLTNRDVGESTFQFSPSVFLRYLRYAGKALWEPRVKR